MWATRQGNYLSHWNDRVAKDIEPLEIQQWLDKQTYGIRSKLRNMMSAVFRHGQKWATFLAVRNTTP